MCHMNFWRSYFGLRQRQHKRNRRRIHFVGIKYFQFVHSSFDVVFGMNLFCFLFVFFDGFIRWKIGVSLIGLVDETGIRLKVGVWAPLRLSNSKLAMVQSAPKCWWSSHMLEPSTAGNSWVTQDFTCSRLQSFYIEIITISLYRFWYLFPLISRIQSRVLIFEQSKVLSSVFCHQWIGSGFPILDTFGFRPLTFRISGWAWSHL